VRHAGCERDQCQQGAPTEDANNETRERWARSRTAGAPRGESGGTGQGQEDDERTEHQERNDERTRSAQGARLQPGEREIGDKRAREGEDPGDHAVSNPGRYRRYATRRLT
jgi:hypothetical protein